MAIANTILAQLGGNKFKVMTGAHSLVAIDKGLMLAFKGCKKVNKLRITLTPADLYLVEFIKMPSATAFANGKEPVVVEKFEDVYAEDLQRIFTEVTGLDTHL
jgi:hypothetical protein